MLPQEGSAVSESGRAVLGSPVLVDSSAVLVSGTAVGRASVADWVQQCFGESVSSAHGRIATAVVRDTCGWCMCTGGGCSAGLRDGHTCCRLSGAGGCQLGGCRCCCAGHCQICGCRGCAGGRPSSACLRSSHAGLRRGSAGVGRRSGCDADNRTRWGLCRVGRGRSGRRILSSRCTTPHHTF